MALTPSTIGNLLLFSIVGLIGWHSLDLHRRGRWLLLDPLNAFWAGIFVCYVQQPLLASDIFISWHSQAVFEKTLFATLWGLVFVVIGYELTWGTQLAKKIPRPPPRLDVNILLAMAFVLIALGCASYAYIFQLSGGGDQWLSVGRGDTDYEKVNLYIVQFADALPAGISLLLFRANMHKISLPGKLLAWLAGVAMWWWFLYLGSRSRIIGFTIIMLAAYYLPRRRNPNVMLAAGIFVALLVIVSFQTNYRGEFTDLSFHLDSINPQELRETVLPTFLGGSREHHRSEISNGAEFNCAMSVVELVPSKVPFNYGYGFLELFTRPIPKSIWKEKIYPQLEELQPILKMANLSESYAGNTDYLAGPAFCFVGYWYFVGGFVALAIGGIFTGVLMRLIRSYYDLGRLNEGIIILYPFLIAIGFSEAAATPLIWLYSLPFVLAPFVIIFYLCGKKLNRARQTTGRGKVGWRDGNYRRRGDGRQQAENRERRSDAAPFSVNAPKTEKPNAEGVERMTEGDDNNSA